MASDDTPGPREPREYDARRNPRRGVRIKPLPRAHHREFRRLCAEVTVYLHSQLSTWKLADRTVFDEPIIQAQLIYWSSAIKWMSHLEYFGTYNDSSKRP